MDHLLIIDKDALRKSIREYIIDSRTGETMTYRETAALDVDTATESSTDVLWEKLQAHPKVEIFDAGKQFVAGEDLVAGQVVVVSDDNTTLVTYVGEAEGDGSGEALPPLDADARPVNTEAGTGTAAEFF